MHTTLFDRCLMKYNVDNWVKRSTGTVSVHPKPYRANNSDRMCLYRVRSVSVCCSMFAKEYNIRKEAEDNLKEHGKIPICNSSANVVFINRITAIEDFGSFA